MSSIKKTTGRQKIAMEKIEKPNSLHVTFSKRSNGIFKKATELATLCGAHPFVLIFSPGGKPHLFVHPSVDAIANRFLNNSSGGAQDQDAASYEEHKSTRIDGVAHRYNELNDQVNVAQKQFDEKRKDNLKFSQYSLITTKVEELSSSMIEKLKELFEQAKHNVNNLQPMSSINMANNHSAGYFDSSAPEVVANQPGELMVVSCSIMQAPDLHVFTDPSVPINGTNSSGSSLIGSSTSNMGPNHDNFGNPLNSFTGSTSSNVVPIPSETGYINSDYMTGPCSFMASNPGGSVEPMVPYETNKSPELIMQPPSSFMAPNKNVPVCKVNQFSELVGSSLPIMSPNRNGMADPSIPNSMATIHAAELDEAIVPSSPFVSAKPDDIAVPNRFHGSEKYNDAERFYQEYFSYTNQS
ncbi:Mads-box protein agl69 [Thalictrum thalictroides]|uniref:Mads-box protein agl69 n=1 Tax=Thalictrum thalictroides TaxID=46969 RepID=A0A7J6W4B8_THATH|nr:Mads-box protein agl69 [Thalictrum thalictroides]